MEPATRERLLRGARTAVVEHGLRALTVEQVLRAAGVSRRTFYQYYSDREAVLVALFDAEVADLVREIHEQVSRASSPIASLHAGIDAYLDFQHHGGRLIALLQAEAANPDSPLHTARELVLDGVVSLVDMRVRALYPRGIDPLVYRSLFLALETLVIHLRRGGALSAQDRDRAASVMKPIFTATLLAVEHLPGEVPS